MEFSRSLLTTLVLLLLAVQVQSVEHCPNRPSSIGDFKDAVIEAVCSFDPDGTAGLSFRNQTRFNHGAGYKLDSELE